MKMKISLHCVTPFTLYVPPWLIPPSFTTEVHGVRTEEKEGYLLQNPPAINDAAKTSAIAMIR